ncbi:hypothetical protein AAG747_27410 [Rapidithrix thailandica]|uniref:Uncharacterized protein n=1 Tax=Rapidithrix thailandica TaxID=413964 RepID=A0AAW9SH76_9BACT
MIDQLDPNLSSTWGRYNHYLKESILNGRLEEAIRFAEELKQPELAFTSGQYPLNWALLYACNEEPEKALNIIRKAFEYGYKNFWRFDPDSHGWGSNPSDEYLRMKPIHEHPAIQSYVKSVYNGKVSPWGMDIRKTPFCWFEKSELSRKNERCSLSKKKLEKGSTVYQFRFFNGSYDIPSQPFCADIEAFDQDEEANANRDKYFQNKYHLEEYRFKVSYSHPLINAFWHRLEDFDLLKTLQWIAEPPVNPTPYVRYSFDEQPLPVYDVNCREKTVEIPINYGTGGEFVDLLYSLIKCGYWKDIFRLLPQLSSHFPFVLLLFQSSDIREEVAAYLGMEELPELMDIALKPYNRKSPKEVQRLANFGKQHPEMLDKLATCLRYYECHLYSNYSPGVNWLFQEFTAFERAKGGGLLDFFIYAPERIPVLAEMKSGEYFVVGLSSGAIDAYSNSLPFLYRTVTLNAVVTGSKSAKKWMDLPLHIQKSNFYKQFKAVHKHTLKLIKQW